MSKLMWVWSKIPVIIRSIIIGLLVQIIGVMPVFMIVEFNVQNGAWAPWSLLLGLPYIFLFVWYFRGKGWPASTSEIRKRNFRVNPMAPGVSKWAFISAVLLGITLCCTSLMGWLLTEWPTAQAEMIKALVAAPKMTILPLFVLATVATGIVEETAYRGYLQVPIEKRHGPVLAIIIAAAAFTFSHNLPNAIIPIFLVGSLGWGVLAYLSNSNLPGIIFHALVDLIFFTLAVYRIDLIQSMQEYSVLESGTTFGFDIFLAAGLVFGALTVISLFKLAKERKAAILSGGNEADLAEGLADGSASGLVGGATVAEGI